MFSPYDDELGLVLSGRDQHRLLQEPLGPGARLDMQDDSAPGLEVPEELGGEADGGRGGDAAGGGERRLPTRRTLLRPQDVFRG